MHWLMYRTRVSSVCLSMPGGGISSTPDISLTARTQFLWIIRWNFLQSVRNGYPSTDSLQWSGTVACFTPQSIIIPLWLITLEPDTDLTRRHLLRLAICVPLSSRTRFCYFLHIDNHKSTNVCCPLELQSAVIYQIQTNCSPRLVHPLELTSFIYSP